MSTAADEIKACCAAAYSSPAARWLLGDSFHPGGAALTSRLAGALAVEPGCTVVDVASGPGSSAVQLAREASCSVLGVDLSPTNVADANRLAAGAGVGDRVRFVVGDAERLPIGDATADGVLCECSLCTFPDKARAACEIARILRPGRRLALSDVTADVDRLPPELATLGGWIACIGGAVSRAALVDLVEGAGMTVETAEPADPALCGMLEGIEARLRAARVLGDGLPKELRGGIERGLELIDCARRAVEGGALGYCVLVARKP